MDRPSKLWGRVKCGYSSSPDAKLSSAMEAWSPKHPRDQAHAGLDQGHGGDLAPRQHEIAQADFFDGTRLDRPLVQAFKAAAEQDGARTGRQVRAPAPGPVFCRAATDRSEGGCLCSTASIAAAATSARITMPGPPPAGVSSTVRCLPKPCSRMSRTSSRQRFFSSALPNSESAQRPRKHFGEEREDGGVPVTRHDRYLHRLPAPPPR